jgi:hypothetical protein
MIKINFPTFAFLDTHPGTLKCKITCKMASQPFQQGEIGDT